MDLDPKYIVCTGCYTLIKVTTVMSNFQGFEKMSFDQLLDFLDFSSHHIGSKFVIGNDLQVHDWNEWIERCTQMVLTEFKKGEV